MVIIHNFPDLENFYFTFHDFPDFSRICMNPAQISKFNNYPNHKIPISLNN